MLVRQKGALLGKGIWAMLGFVRLLGLLLGVGVLGGSALKGADRVEVEDLPPAEAFDVYLLMGQSNMAGRDLALLEEQVEDAALLALDYEGVWRVAKDPIHKKTGRIEPGVGPGIAFGRRLLAAKDNGSIGLVPCAVGGSPLRRWERGGDLYEEALERARHAMQYGRLKGVIWHQGETDSAKEAWARSYGARLGQMIADLREDLGEPELPVVVGQIGEFVGGEDFLFVEDVKKAIRDVSETVERVGFASSEGLLDKGDDLHFDGASAMLLGERFAEAMLELERVE